MKATLFTSLFIFGVLIASQHVHGQPTPVQTNAFDAVYYPTEETGLYGIIVFTGSAGGKNEFMAKKLNAMGYPVLSLAYFDWDSKGELPNSLELIPLEYISAAKQWLMDHPSTRNDGVIVYGVSKGAELALLLASYDQDYKAVIATAPSSVVWTGIPQNPSNDYSNVSSSWRYQGTPVDYIQYLNREPFREEGITMLDWHAASIHAATNYADARIKVENVEGPILLFSGGQDTVWPSAQMGNSLCAIANLTSKLPKCKHVIYEAAPHLLGDYGPDARLEMDRFLRKLNSESK